MYLRKVYLKIRIFLYSIRYIINSVLILLMSLTLVYLFANSFIFGILINNQANNDALSKKYESAINLYNIEYTYYKLNHFSDDNQEIYFAIPYRRAICYLKENKKEDSIDSMSDGLATIQKQYGVMSRETAYFMRKYLIEYYLDNDRYKSAEREFKNLIIIYKKIGYNDTEMADLVRLSGDLYYAQKNYDVAMDFYKKAYNTISKEKNIDYDVFAKIVERITKYEINNGNGELAIEIYKSSIETLKASGKKQTELAATLLLQLGDYYIKNDKTKDAISAYEQALVLIKTLPKNNYTRQNRKVYLATLKDLYNQNGQFHDADEVNIELTRERRFSFF